jgi:hypothetical protein
MKKLILFTISVLLSAAIYGQTPVKVLYLATDATGITLIDLFYNNIIANSSYTVTKRVTQAAFTGNYNDYDVIVLHESITGSEGANATHETGLLKGVDKPILNFKTFVYNNTGTARWDWGTPNSGKAGKGIYAKEKTHPVYKDITLDGTDSVYLFSTYVAKNSQPTTIAVGGYEIGSTQPAAAGGGTVSIHDLPGTVRLGAGKTSKYLMISIFSSSFVNLTADGIKLIYNGLDYLVSGTQWHPAGSGVHTQKESNVYFDGNIVRNADRYSLTLFDATGKKLINSMTDLNMASYPKGLYIIVPEKDGKSFNNIKIAK